MQTKHLTGEVKSLETDDPNGSFEVILSTPSLDRDGEIVDKGAFEPLPDHITFDVDHGLSVETTVGSGAPRYEDGVLKVTGTFSSIPRAQEVRTLVKEGHIRSTSVAYKEQKVLTSKDGVRHITKADLFNGAFVPVPANVGAVIVAAKAHEDREQYAAAIEAADDIVLLSGERVIGLVVRHVVDGKSIDVIEIVQAAPDAPDTKTPDDTPKADPAPAASPAVAGARARLLATKAEADLLLG